MRVLATIGFSFSAGVFLAALLPWTGWQLYAAGGVLLLALAWLISPIGLPWVADRVVFGLDDLCCAVKGRIRE